jgi:ribonuclease J
MKVCIHRGTKEIGGSCVEIETDGKRILVDIGLPLDPQLSDIDLPPISGLAKCDPSLLGVLISHLHLDHYGLANKITEDIPFLISKGALNILKAISVLFTNQYEFRNTIILKHKKPINLGPFKITPYLMDHSAYDAFAFLIEADGKKIFYTGDFRGHGRKQKLLDDLIHNSPNDVNILFMEGSTLGRSGIDNIYPSEDDLEKQFIDHFNGAEGISFVWTSAQNIDRLVTIYKACRQTGKTMVLDLYTANILRSLNNLRIPQPGWKQLKVFVPKFQRIKIKEKELFDFVREFSGCRIYLEEIERMGPELVVLFRPSMAKEFDKFSSLEKSILIYSLWFGYLHDEHYAWFKYWIKKNNISMYYCHTSGHAHISDLQRLAESIAPETIVPIHSFEPQMYPKLFKNVRLENDGIWWDV